MAPYYSQRELREQSTVSSVRSGEDDVFDYLGIGLKPDFIISALKGNFPSTRLMAHQQYG